jgi:hypothetical protein
MKNGFVIYMNAGDVTEEMNTPSRQTCYVGMQRYQGEGKAGAHEIWLNVGFGSKEELLEGMTGRNNWKE